MQIWLIHSQGPSEQKPIKNLGEKGAWAAQFLSTSYYLIAQWVKLRTSNFVCTFMRSIGTKAHLKISLKIAVSRVRSQGSFARSIIFAQGLSKIFRAPVPYYIGRIVCSSLQ